MNQVFTRRFFWLLWAGLSGFLVLVWLRPVSDGRSRLEGAVLLPAVWCGLIALLWKLREVRWGLLAITLAAAVFLVAPGRTQPDQTKLRQAFGAGLRRYVGDKYFWGGESPLGIDCSGLIRRGMIDGAFLRGIGSLDPGLVRYSLWLWWHDCTAADFGKGNGATMSLFSTPSLNKLDESRIEPGDLAVTTSGVHILAYLGNHEWIEADPQPERVVIEQVPSPSVWFDMPMNIVRWRILAAGAKREE